jgi:hypothetical protein
MFDLAGNDARRSVHVDLLVPEVSVDVYWVQGRCRIVCKRKRKQGAQARDETSGGGAAYPQDKRTNYAPARGTGRQGPACTPA